MGLREIQEIRKFLTNEIGEEAAASETYEHWAKKAEEEGLMIVARKLREIAGDESRHSNILDELLTGLSAEEQIVEAVQIAAGKMGTPIWNGEPIVKKSGRLCTSSRYHEYWKFDEEANIGLCSICNEVINENTGNVVRMAPAEKRYRLPSNLFKVIEGEEADTYEGRKNKLYNIAEELKKLMYDKVKRENPGIDEITANMWSDVKIVEKSQWFYMDVYTYRFQIGKSSGAVYAPSGGNMGTLDKLDAENFFNAL